MSPKILALDTSTDACSVACYYDGSIIAEYFEIMPKKHSLFILQNIKRILDECGWTIAALDAIAFANGPGSFTGLRLAASVVQGLALPHELPVAAVSTLQAMAQGASDEFKMENSLVALDARMQEIYWGAYQLDKNGYAQAVTADQLSKASDVVLPLGWDLKQVQGIGDAWKTYPEILQERCGIPTMNIREDYYPQARYIAKLGARAYQDGDLVCAAAALPVYLRETVVKK